MKRHDQQVGVRKWAGQDFIELQAETLKALDGFFAEYGSCVVCGCEVTQTGNTFRVAPGLTALEGKDYLGNVVTMIVPFAGIPNTPLPMYLTLAYTIRERDYADGKVKPIAYDYYAKPSTATPAAGTAFLKITQSGTPHFVDVIQDASHRFMSDTQKTQWDAKETPAGAQAKANSALANAETYTNARETAITSATDEKLTQKADKLLVFNSGALRSGADYDLYTGPGVYSIETGSYPDTSVHGPEKNCYGTLVVSRALLFTTQMAVIHPGNIVYVRVGYNGGWRPWITLYTTANFNPDSKLDKAGGVLSGTLTTQKIILPLANAQTGVSYGLNTEKGDSVISYDNDSQYFGAATQKTILRSNNNDLVHRRGSVDAKIFDSANFNPDSKETPEGAQAKANAALASAKTYTSDREAAIRADSFVENRETINASDLDTFKKRPSGTYVVAYTGADRLLTVFGGNTTISASSLEFYHSYDQSVFQWRSAVDGNRYSPWKTIYHSGNLDIDSKLDKSGGVLSGPLITRKIVLSLDEYGSSYGIYTDAGDCLVSYDEKNDYLGCAGKQTILRSGSGKLMFRRQATDVEIYDKGNLSTATATAEGLMSAEDKIKVNAINEVCVAAGRVYGDGVTAEVYCGTFEVKRVSRGEFVITHNIHTLKYTVSVMPFQNAGNWFIASKDGLSTTVMFYDFSEDPRSPQFDFKITKFI